MKLIKNKSIVIFEVNDNNRSSNEYGKYAGKEYFIPFTEFIESLGFDISTHAAIEEITINGHRFGINTKNASYASKNQYNREVNIRKSENRYITLGSGHSPLNIAKIHFNKEYDANKLRAKINAAIKSKEDVIQYVADAENRNKNNTTFIAELYVDAGIVGTASNLSISKGEIKIHINGAVINFNTKGEVIKVILHQKESNGESETVKMFSNLNIMYDDINTLSNMIKQNPIPQDLLEWSLGSNNGSYIFKTLEYSKY